MGNGLRGGSRQRHGQDPIFGTAVEDALRAIAPGCELLQVRRQLERTLGSELALRASQLWNLRERARRRGLDPALRWLTSAGLEQLSAPLVAADRARQLRAGPAARVADLTSGIGGDSPILALDEECVDGDTIGELGA